MSVNLENEKKIITSELIAKWSTIYTPGGTVIITPAPLSTRVTTSGEENEGFGRWSVLTIERKQDTKISIINIYSLCDENSNTGVSKTITQQWDILEESSMEEIRI